MKQITYPCLCYLGEWDGAGATVKNKLEQEQLWNHGCRKLQNAGDVVDYLRVALPGRAESSYQKKKDRIFRKFWHIGETETNRRKKWQCTTIDGSSSLHSFSSISGADPTKLMVRELSCFCGPCLMRDWNACENSAHVPRWRCLRIKTKIARDVREQMVRERDGEDSQYGGDGVGLSDLLEPGDNFAVPAMPGNDENVEFFDFLISLGAADLLFTIA